MCYSSQLLGLVLMLVSRLGLGLTLEFRLELGLELVLEEYHNASHVYCNLR